mmetsp:Transcript_366/g.1064  ORF Transcript_366/g.1064 Transcript_366/m.1064 type:complete len:253 (-) Transcript_366:245-1003(-)
MLTQCVSLLLQVGQRVLQHQRSQVIGVQESVPPISTPRRERRRRRPEQMPMRRQSQAQAMQVSVPLLSSPSRRLQLGRLQPDLGTHHQPEVMNTQQSVRSLILPPRQDRRGLRKHKEQEVATRAWHLEAPTSWCRRVAKRGLGGDPCHGQTFQLQPVSRSEALRQVPRRFRRPQAPPRPGKEASSTANPWRRAWKRRRRPSNCTRGRSRSARLQRAVAGWKASWEAVACRGEGWRRRWRDSCPAGVPTALGA